MRPKGIALLSFLLLSAPARGEGPVCPAAPWDARIGAQPAFDRWFEDGTVRLDYEHTGDATEESVTLHALRSEGPWAGSRTWLVDPTGFGKYRAEVRDAKSGDLLWSRGFCTLFGEWQTTDEAKTSQRSFPETLRFPRPKTAAEVSVHSRGRDGAFSRIWAKTLGPEDLPKVTAGEAGGPEVLTLQEGGEPATTLDIVIVPAGYPVAQDEKLRRDLARFAKILMSTPPFDGHRGGIAVRGVIDHAERIGAAEPRKGRPLPTNAEPESSSVDPTFDTLGSARYLNALRHWRLRDLAGAAPYDAIFVMVNTSRYGGAGIFNDYAVFPSDNDYDEYVFVHEFGHSFGGLGDEYYTSSVAYSDFYPMGVEPWEPNVTALLGGREGLKWRDLVGPEVPIPTPEADPWKGEAGAFEGAGYSAKGLYRPAFDCKMFSKRTIDFCAVCMCAVEQMIRLHTR
ncbi:MAG: M64 family metallopeptidase [Pseudomonadota bacterium]